MDLVSKYNLNVFGHGPRTILFAHGYGCDQNMWRHVAPAFVSEYKVVLFDQIGCGRADAARYSPLKYDSLAAYAEDVLEIARELKLEDAIFVGHSVSAMIGVLASKREPTRFRELVLVGPSPRYLNDGDYIGGFQPADIDGLLESLEANYLGWSSTMAPAIMGNPDRPELGAELVDSFCRMDPIIAKNFARVTFLSDNRADLKHVRARTLVLQCADDIIAPLAVGEYVHREIPGSQLVFMRATGHCPNLSAPEETTAEIQKFLRQNVRSHS